ncbi:hypothetical protein ZYGR_0AK07410 [Zygosaccharomyces rouxii]|uniref:Thioredoxin domain-containing protein n=1 Tax=Zygosaccharomyces rouxii TaxID=4956 RepID=A0A1Q3AEP9_ZYGRO|nr:hypothetical protein ZYGR_0AK07410 [Zygosaccharomyces rouxii]
MFRTSLRAFQGIRFSSYTSIPKLSTKETFQEAFKKPGLSVFDFYATWCGPCKAMAPILGKLKEEYPKAAFYKVDVDENLELAKELDVMAMPTFLLSKDGSVLEKIVGANPSRLEKVIKDNS